jgi:catechol 2,3-dioxygenase-like lactoylglutathione lyase family enzyme
MPVELNHTIVAAHDRYESAGFLAGLLGLEVGDPWGPFLPVTLSNGVSLDFASTDQDIASQHYAFLVSDDEFDEIFERVQRAEITYYADPTLALVNEINHNHHGRGFYFLDPAGHGLEVLTRPYGYTGDGVGPGPDGR